MSYPITVVVPTMTGWPRMRLSVDAVLPQVQAAGGQLVVADGSGGAVPAELLRDRADLVWLEMPGARTYELRQAAYRRADGEVIAVTEDHCRPADDWVAAALAAHAERPAAAMIYGSVENGTTDHLIDWALYLAGYGAFAPPLDAHPRGVPGHANVTWKRWIFDRLPPSGDRVIEFRFNEAIRAAGYGVAGEARLRVAHHQCDSIGRISATLYHNGRAIAGLRRRQMVLADWLRLVAPPLVALLRTIRTARTTLPKPDLRRPTLAALPLIALLHACHAAGELVGYLRGPGDSWQQLH